MKASRGPLTVILALAAIALAALAWNQYQELIAMRAAQSSLDFLSRSAKRLADAEARIGKLRQRLAAQTSAAKAPSGGSASAAARPADWRSSPEAQRLIAATRDYRISIAIDSAFGPLFKKLNLTPEQIAQFKSLISDKKVAVLDAFNAGREQGLTPGSPTMKQALLEASSSVDSEIEQELGPTAFAQFQQYDATLPERNAVNLVARNLNAAGAPLSEDQTEQLVQIFAANRPASASQNLGYVLGMATTPINSPDVQAAAAALSPAQLAGLQAVQQQQQARSNLLKLMYPPPPPPASKG